SSCAESAVSVVGGIICAWRRPTNASRRCPARFFHRSGGTVFSTFFQGSDMRTRGKALGSLLGLCMAFFVGSSWAFSLDDVAGKAEKLAAAPYVPAKSNLPAAFREMAFADYQQLRFREDKGYWRDAETPFERSEEHTSELQSRENLVCRLL